MDNDLKKGKGRGFFSKDGKIYLKRCFECGLENWAIAVSSGQCAFCGFDANKEVRNQ